MTEPDAPLDEVDLAILDRIAAVHDVLDPPPPGLDLRVRFALDLADLDVDVARMTPDLLVGSGARGDGRTRTITFTADALTIMVTVTKRADGLLRIDGWLAPPAPLAVELRFPEPAPRRTTRADEAGRFVFDESRTGLAQLLVRPGDGGGPGIVTPSFEL